jgi:hypothetical protein
MADHGFDGSYATLCGVAVQPLTEFRASNQPAAVRNTGSTDTHHSYTPGRSNQSITLGFLGARCPDVGTVGNLSATLNATQGTISITPVVVTQCNVSGRKDGEIRGSLTLRPSALAAGTTNVAGARLDIQFNGTKCVAFGTTFSSGTNPMISLNYSASCAEVDSAGSGDTDVLISAGIPDRTLTMEIAGGTTIAKGTTTTTTVTWNDTGTLGTFANAVLISVEPGNGSIDDVVTTQFTFRELPST